MQKIYLAATLVIYFTNLYSTFDIGSPEKDFNYFDLPKTPHPLQAHTE